MAEFNASKMNNNHMYYEDNDSCSFNDCNSQALIFIPEVQITFLVLYSLVSLMGIVGNMFIIVTVVR